MAIEPPSSTSTGGHEADPARLVLPTCAGCGAMAVLGSCERGCSEERLDLVGADAFDELSIEAARSRSAAAEFGAIAQELVRTEPPEEGYEAAYRRLQQRAREALRAHPERRTHSDEHVRRVTTWWCPECGGLEAPQPCLGICVWRRVEWVPERLWQRELERTRVALQTETALRRLLRRAALVAPREHRWQANWQALSAAALQALRGVSPPHRDSGR